MSGIDFGKEIYALLASKEQDPLRRAAYAAAAGKEAIPAARKVARQGLAFDKSSGGGGGVNDDIGQCFPVLIVSVLNPTTYFIDVYGDGPDNAPTVTGAACTQLQIAGTDKFAAGTWALAVKAGDGHYYFQLPVWQTRG